VLAEALCAAGLLTVMLLCQDSIFAAMTTTTLLLLLHLITLVSSVVFYRVSPFHPLAEYPGPLIHKVTKLRMMFLLQSGRHHEEIRRLHLQYGRFVRTGKSKNVWSPIRVMSEQTQGPVRYPSTRTRPPSPSTRRRVLWPKLTTTNIRAGLQARECSSC
jgi:hypothetical protein